MLQPVILVSSFLLAVFMQSTRKVVPHLFQNFCQLLLRIIANKKVVNFLVVISLTIKIKQNNTETKKKGKLMLGQKCFRKKFVLQVILLKQREFHNNATFWNHATAWFMIQFSFIFLVDIKVFSICYLLKGEDGRDCLFNNMFLWKLCSTVNYSLINNQRKKTWILVHVSFLL